MRHDGRNVGCQMIILPQGKYRCKSCAKSQDKLAIGWCWKRGGFQDLKESSPEFRAHQTDWHALQTEPTNQLNYPAKK